MRRVGSTGVTRRFGSSPHDKACGDTVQDRWKQYQPNRYLMFRYRRGKLPLVQARFRSSYWCMLHVLILSSQVTTDTKHHSS